MKAFAESALWVIASPAAEADPMNAPAAISDVIGTTDAEILGRFDRTGGVDFLPLNGAYRVLGHSGDQAAPVRRRGHHLDRRRLEDLVDQAHRGGAAPPAAPRTSASSAMGPSRRPHRPGVDGVRQR